MRTTLDIDEDVLESVTELARGQNLTAGQVVSRLLRQALNEQTAALASPGQKTPAPQTVAGFCPFATGTAVVANDAVNRLRGAEGL